MRQFEQSLLIVDDVKVIDVGSHLGAALLGDAVSHVIFLTLSNEPHRVCDHVQLFKIDQVIVESLVSFMNKCNIFQ